MSGTEANTQVGDAERAESGSARAPFRWRAFFAALATFGIIAAVVGVGVLVVLGHRPLEARAEELVQATPPRVEIAWPEIGRAKLGESAGAKGASATSGSGIVLAENKPEPPETWLPMQFQQELLAAADEAAAHALKGFRPDPLAAVGRAMEASGWFVGRPTIELEGQNTIRVSGAWRVPLAVVRVNGRDRLMSWEAYPMPPEYLEGGSGLPVVLGAAEGPVLAEGGGLDFSQRWPGEDVPAAAELLATLHAQKWYGQIAGVDVSEFGASRALWLVTTQKTRVLWGGPASRPLLGETTTATKIARLGEIFRRFGRLDAGRPKIDISGSHPVEIDVSATGGR